MVGALDERRCYRECGGCVGVVAKFKSRRIFRFRMETGLIDWL